MSSARPPSEVQVPVWVVIVGYLLCWTIGSFFLYHEVTGTLRTSGLIVGVFLVLLPPSGVNPAVVIRALLARLG